MGEESLIQNASGTVEGYGLTVLDVVKHAAKAIIVSLGENDRFSLVWILVASALTAPGFLQQQREDCFVADKVRRKDEVK